LPAAACPDLHERTFPEAGDDSWAGRVGESRSPFADASGARCWTVPRHADQVGEVRGLVFGAEAGAYHAGVQHGGGDASAVQAAGQFVAEHDVGQLRLAVGTLPGVVPLALQVIEVDAAHGLGAAHLGLGGHVGGKAVHGGVARCGADIGCGSPRAGRITAGDADPGAQRGEPDGGGLADATGASGDEDGLAGHEGCVSHG
jgi:hypothetical protein